MYTPGICLSPCGEEEYDELGSNLTFCIGRFAQIKAELEIVLRKSVKIFAPEMEAYLVPNQVIYQMNKSLLT